jgi:1,2-diacylglycerol 3-alpha-glucosyltransferase
MKKLLLVADTNTPKVDGTLSFMKEFIKRSEGFDLKLLVPDFGDKKTENVYHVKTSRWFKMSGYPSMKLLSWKNFKIIKKAVRETDIVFAQGPALLSFLSVYYGRKYDKKVFFYTHVLSWELFAKFSPIFSKKLFSWIIKKLSFYYYNFCDVLFVPYEKLRTKLIRGGVVSKIIVAKLGVDINYFKKNESKDTYKIHLGIDPEKRVIGYVGRISKEKNIELLIESYKKLKEEMPDLFLLIVGDGSKEIIEELNELKDCRITGFVNNVPKYLNAMDVFVMPSLTETTSLATLEAMSCSLPVIVTKVGFIPDYVIKGYNGIFIPSNSPVLLSLKIRKVLESESLRKNIGENARKTIVYSFSWKKTMNKIRRVIQVYS